MSKIFLQSEFNISTLKEHNLISLKHLMNLTYKQQVDTYRYCPLYYIFTGRKKTWIFQFKNSLIIACLHPHQPNEVIVFPEIIENNEFLNTPHVLKYFLNQGYFVSVGRLSFSEYEKLSTILNEEKITFYSFKDRMMDWVYPNHHLSTNLVASLEGKVFQKIRNKIRRAKNNVYYKRESRVVIQDFFEKIIKRWQCSIPLQKEGLATGIKEYYLAITKIIDKYPGYLDGIVFYDFLNEPCGITIWHNVSSELANLYVNIGDRNITGLSDFQIVMSCRELLKAGINEINLGGSEEKKLDDFKRKYLPTKSWQLLSIRIS